MSRDLPADLTAAIEGPVVRGFFAFRLAFADPVHVWTGRGTINFDDANGGNHDWLGAGDLGAFDTIGESTDGSAVGVKVALNKIPSEFAGDIDTQVQRGALFEVYLGALNETFQVVQATKLIWKGRVDTYTISDGGSTLSVEITGESRGIDQRRPAIKRFTDEWQQRKYPGDRFFEYAPQMTEVPILWADSEGGASPVGGFGSFIQSRLYDQET